MMTLDVYNFVVDMETDYLFWNKYCAQCNGYSNLRPVRELELFCQDYQIIYKATEYDEMINMSLREPSCLLRHQTSNMTFSNCFPEMYVIDTCDFAPSEWKYDEEVERSCSQFTNTMDQVFTVNPVKMYKNIFCYICNKNIYPNEKETRVGDSSAIFEAVQPLPQLIQFSRQDINNDTSKIESNLNQCEETHWLSPDGTSKPLHCSPGKKLISGNCRTSNSDVTGLGYRLSTWFMLRPTDVKLDHFSLESISGSLASQMQNETNLNARAILLLFETSIFSVGKHTGVYKNQSPLLITADIFILAQLEISRDDFEDFIVNTLIRTPLNIAENTDIYVVPYLRSGNLTDFHLKACRRWISERCLYEQLYSNSKVNYDILNRRDLLVKVTNTLVCSFVSFNKSEYIVDAVKTGVPPTVKVTVNLGNTKLIFSKVSEINMLEIDGDGVLNVCREALDEKLASLAKTLNDLNYYANILTLTCMSASMLCLLVSLVTFIRFSELRNSAGKNNMFLCTSLLLAQASLLANSYFSGYKYFCIAFGISTHFLWVWSLAWTLVCSIRMLQMVSTKYKKPQKPADERRALIKNILLTLALPTISVAIVVISSEILSQGRKIGYGEIKCFIDYGIHLGLCLITPLALITVCNVALFIVTVVRIYTISRSVTQQNNFSTSDRQLSVVYVTLSLMTGALWLFAIVGEGTGSKPLTFTSIILNGLQGVFFFVACICNNRVVRLYCPSIGQRDVTSKTPFTT